MNLKASVLSTGSLGYGGGSDVDYPRWVVSVSSLAIGITFLQKPSAQATLCQQVSPTSSRSRRYVPE